MEIIEVRVLDFIFLERCRSISDLRMYKQNINITMDQAAEAIQKAANTGFVSFRGVDDDIFFLAFF